MTERAEITGAAVPGAEVEAAGTAAVGTGASGTGRAVLWWAPSYAYVVEGAVPRAAGAKGDAVRPLLGVYSLFIVPVFQGAGGVFMPLGDDIFAFCTGVFGGISSLGWRRRGGVLTLRYDVGKY